MKISIIVPAYNEGKTIVKVLDRLVLAKLNVKKEIIIIDDGSKDNTKKIISNYLKKSKAKGVNFKFHSKKNGGKGSAVRRGISRASGEIITIQDADLEYDPNDYEKLIEPIIRGEATVVYGSRALNKKNSYSYFSYFLGNLFLSATTSILYGSKITDMETCYKVFKAEVIKNLSLTSNGFDIEPEITAKILKSKIKIKEIPISYNPRTKEDGKKINWKDGLRALKLLIKLRFSHENF